jgi:hypothetical protein
VFQTQHQQHRHKLYIKSCRYVPLIVLIQSEFAKRKVAKSGGTAVQVAHIADSEVEGELPPAFSTQPNSTLHVIYIHTTSVKSEGRYFVI